MLQSRAQLLEQKLDIKTRSFEFDRYPNCFVGKDAIQVIIDSKFASNETEAIEFGNQLIHKNLILDVTNKHTFKNNNLLYQFTETYHNSKIEPQQNKSISTDTSITVT